MIPSISSVASQIASRLRTIKVTVTCRICKERWEAVMMEAPALGLELIGEKRDSLEFARAFYQNMFDKAHPHKMDVTAEFTTSAAYPPRQVAYA